MNTDFPVSDAERLPHLDVLRGFALLGILLVNFEWFTRPVTSLVLGPDVGLSGADFAVDALIAVLAEGKFYALFSLLFGAGFALTMQRAQAAGHAYRGMYLRRLAVLLVFGLVHVTLVWPGDILFVYAVTALAMMLLFARTPTSRLPKWAIVLLLLPPAVNWLLTGLVGLASVDPATAAEVSAGFAAQDVQMREAVGHASAAYANGSFADAVHQRLVDFGMLLSWAPFWIPPVLGFFLLGRWLIASGRLRDPTAHRAFFRNCTWAGLSLGTPLALSGYVLLLERPLHVPSPMLAVSATLTAAGAALMAFGFLGLIVGHAGRLRWLAPAGRMALSNYLLQSAFWTSLFYGYGLGGELPPRHPLAAGLAVLRRAGRAEPLVAGALPVRTGRMGMAQFDLPAAAAAAPS